MNADNYLDYLKGLCVILITGNGCANCINLNSPLKTICSERQIKFFELDSQDLTKEFVTKYQLYSVPTIMLFSDSKLIASTKGYQPKEILELWVDFKIEERGRHND